MKDIVVGTLTIVAALAVLFAFAKEEALIPVSRSVNHETVIFAAGDMLFDRKIRQVSEQFGPDYPFSCIESLIASADFAVANLEGPITENPSRSVGSIVGSIDNYFFTFPTTTAALLARHNFRVVGIGNNHILNFGYAGLLSTQDYLSRAGVGYFGGVQGNEAVFETEVNGVTLAFVGYNEFGGSSVAEVANIIAAEKKEGKTVIVYAHWGDEYMDSSPRLRPIAELFAEQGVSAIIGAHPHVVLGHEYIGDTLVYYSLGNFIFDQYFSEDVRSGLTLMLHVGKNGRVTAVEHPVAISRDGRTCPVVQEGII
jgi:poly-gamma-glutamate synthesis protein (capsule biosynthesis protein)